MFKFEELEVIQLEITNNCQASCPMCLRNVNGGIDNPLIKINDWSIEDFKTILNQEVLSQITCISFCGNFGEPIMNNDLIKMCEYVKVTSPSLRIVIHTNGSARSSSWWENLSKALPIEHKVIFAIDGLEDTHHLYRTGTNFKSIINNMKTFIAAGGSAEWEFIRFHHNQHQVSQAELLAKELGVINFRVKDSKRHARSFPVVDKDGRVTHYINQPSGSIVQFVSKSMLTDYKQWKEASNVSCFVKKDKEIFIDAHYQVTPCCMTASMMYMNCDIDLHKQYQLYSNDMPLEQAQILQDELWQLINKLGGLNTLTNGVKQIINSDAWQGAWEQGWKDKSIGTCIIMCSADSPYIKISQQTIKQTTNE